MCPCTSSALRPGSLIVSHCAVLALTSELLCNRATWHVRRLLVRVVDSCGSRPVAWPAVGNASSVDRVRSAPGKTRPAADSLLWRARVIHVLVSLVSGSRY